MSSPKPVALTVERQLFSNQLWETIAFCAKAGFMLSLTPWMIRLWGARGYGEFALASSTVVLLAILDLGIRAHTRVALCQGHGGETNRAAAIVVESVAALGIVSILALAVAALLSWSGMLDRLLKISPGSHHLLFVTTVMSMAVLLSGLLLEPMIAAGRIGWTKLANALGWLAAIPSVAVILWQEGTVTSAVFAWLACLLGANICVIVWNGATPRQFYRDLRFIRRQRFFEIIREGFWFNAANVAWLTKTYGATLLISAIYGPVVAGYFFILLRLSEVISALGAISSDLSLAEIARAKTVAQRRLSFASSYSWSLIFCSHSALIIGFFTSDFLRLWIGPNPATPPFAGLVVAALGLGSALNRTTTFAAAPLALGRKAARCSFTEAAAFVAALALVPQSVGFLLKLGLAALSALALLPAARAISHRLAASSLEVWVRPFIVTIPFVTASTGVLLLAIWSATPLVKVVALFACGALTLLNIYSWQRAQRPDVSPTWKELSPSSC